MSERSSTASCELAPDKVEALDFIIRVLTAKPLYTDFSEVVEILTACRRMTTYQLRAYANFGQEMAKGADEWRQGGAR